MASPITRRAAPQINRPAGRIQGNQSGIRLGIGARVLRIETHRVGSRRVASVLVAHAPRGCSYHANGSRCISGGGTVGYHDATTRDDARVHPRPDLATSGPPRITSAQVREG